jgi:hypothetical protein
MRLLHRLAIVATLAFASVAPASATTLAPLTVEQKVDASDLVVRGTVESVWAEEDDHGHIFTRALVRVTQVMKGAADVDDYITVEAAGGVLENAQMLVPGSARYSVGEDTVLFLTDKPSRGVYGTGAMGLGKYTVRPDPLTGAPLLVQFMIPQDKAYDARFIPVPPVDQRVTLGAIEARVLARAELGWDGQPIPGISNERLRTINKLQPGVR